MLKATNKSYIDFISWSNQFVLLWTFCQHCSLHDVRVKYFLKEIREARFTLHQSHYEWVLIFENARFVIFMYHFTVNESLTSKNRSPHFLLKNTWKETLWNTNKKRSATYLLKILLIGIGLENTECKWFNAFQSSYESWCEFFSLDKHF